MIISQGGEILSDKERELMKEYLENKKKKLAKRNLERGKDHLWHQHDSLEHKKKGRPLSK